MISGEQRGEGSERPFTAARVASGDASFEVELERIYAAQQQNRAAVAASTAAQRIEKLRRLEAVLLRRQDEVRAAMWQDNRRPAAEVDLAEIYPVASEARHAARHLRSWMRPRRVRTNLALSGSSSSIVHEPKGMVLIIAPWNFPFNLTLGPLVSAVAAGNCVMLKPSEFAPASSAFIREIVHETFDQNEVAVVEGDSSVAEALLRRRFDHIFFTGSAPIARHVLRAAAEHLTPVTLELGGKSPIIVDAGADVREAARKVAWGKFFNSGQVCIAPDYALVHESVQTEFLENLRESLETFGESCRGHLINDRHAERIRAMIEQAVTEGARIAIGGAVDGREAAPTVLTNVSDQSSVMREEIFGPVLPVLSWRDREEVVARIATRESPLAIYLFTKDRSLADYVIRGTRAGGTAVNHAMVQFFQLELPFGGVGGSGMGKAHGIHGFETFSNARSILRQWLPFSPIDLLFPPYRGWLKQKLIDFTVRRL
ncbi:MAG TPA: aldehyde dehydrogenase family protein [Thermoanaerobaculia bacterium]